MSTLAASSGEFIDVESGFFERLRGGLASASTGPGKQRSETPEPPAWAWVAVWASTNLGVFLLCYFAASVIVGG